MASFLALLSRLEKIRNPPTAPKLDLTTNASGSHTDPITLAVIRFGILGAANIAPEALIRPAKSHPEATVYAIAARDPLKAQAFAAKYGIPKVHANYDELIRDPDVDAVYNPLPNGLHYEWTMKALQAGKHVLLEKPSSNTADETRRMFEFAEEKGLVLLEAFHYRFHPAVQRVKEILDSGELGKIEHVDATMNVSKFIFPPTDIRFDYSLGGGALMDLGCYTINLIRYLTSSSDITSILDVSHRLFEPSNAPEDYVSKIDSSTAASLTLSNDITATLSCDMQRPFYLGVIPRFPVHIGASVECENGKLKIYNFMIPSVYHTITVTPKKGRSRTEKVYTFAKGGLKGEDWWITYRYQLEAFVNKLKGRDPQTWISKEDSIANMEWIERIYAEKGLGSRPKSEYVCKL